MRSLVVYESMYGNTHEVAEAVGRGLTSAGPTEVVGIDQIEAGSLDHVDLVIVGGPTHAHSLSRLSTRRAAIRAAAGPRSELHLDAAATEFGLRDWLESLPYPAHGWRHAPSGEPAGRDRLGAAFDTRADGPAALTGRASREISRQLHRHGFELFVDPESFLVGRKDGQLLRGETARAEAWGRKVARAAVARQGRIRVTSSRA